VKTMMIAMTSGKKTKNANDDDDGDDDYGDDSDCGYDCGYSFGRDDENDDFDGDGSCSCCDYCSLKDQQELEQQS